LLFSVLLAPLHAVQADDWPHWRGANRNGIVAEPSGWTSRGWLGREPVWTRNVGEGGTSPIVVKGRVYTMGWSGGRDTVWCLNATTGAVVWTAGYASPRHGRHATGDEGLYAGPSSTPEYDPQTGYLYTLGVDGELNCWDTNSDGRRLWRLNLYDECRVPRRPKIGRQGLRDYGYTTAPLGYGDWVIVEVGDDEGNLMAFGKTTGKRLWASQCKDPAGHTGGLVPMTVEGVPCVAVLTLHNLLVARLDRGHEGETVAQYEWATEFANSIATPAVEGDSVLITSGYNHDSICRLKITLGGVRKLWEHPLHSKICSPVIHRGQVYWAFQQLHCLDFATGEPRWAGGSFGDAGSCVVTGDGRLLVWAGRGKLVLAETAAASPRAYKPLAEINGIFATDVWPHVVLAGGRIYCKDRSGNLKCFTTARDSTMKSPRDELTNSAAH
jgi:outer membrane protein assembly factor BamB